MQSNPHIDIKSFPLRTYMWKGIFAISVITLVVASTYFYSQNVFFPTLAFLIVTMPIVNFVFPSHYLFFGEHFSKKQLFTEFKFRYDAFKSFKTRTDGILVIKKNSKSGEYIYIFDETNKVTVSDFLKEKGLTEL